MHDPRFAVSKAQDLCARQYNSTYSRHILPLAFDTVAESVQHRQRTILISVWATLGDTCGVLASRSPRLWAQSPQCSSTQQYKAHRSWTTGDALYATTCCTSPVSTAVDMSLASGGPALYNSELSTILRVKQQACV